MKRAMLFAAAAALFAAAPVRATESIICRAADRADLSLNLIVGHLAGAVVSQAQLSEGRTTRMSGDGEQLMLTQSWIDEQEIKLDLADSNGEAYVARLRTRRAGRELYRGTLNLGDRTHRVSCRTEG